MIPRPIQQLLVSRSLQIPRLQFIRLQSPLSSAYLDYLRFCTGETLSLTKDFDQTPPKFKIIEDWPTPTNLAELRSFVGIIQYYRISVPNISRLDAPLTVLAKEDTPVIWSKGCDIAFAQLKKLATSTSSWRCRTLNYRFR